MPTEKPMKFILLVRRDPSIEMPPVDRAAMPGRVLACVDDESALGARRVLRQ
jgi:hypothetical protein